MGMRWVIGLQGCLKNRKVCLFGSIFVMGGGASLVLLCTGNVHFFGGIYSVGRWYFWKPFHLYFV